MVARVRALRWTGWHELGLFAAAYLAYFGIRAVTQGQVDAAVENATRLFRWERDLGVQWERAIQDAVLDRDTLVDVLNGIYIYGHWPVLILGGLALFHLSRPNYLRLRNVCLLSGGLGLVMTKAFVDDVIYNEKRNEVVLVKYLD